ncbi:hypothetical protein [Hydrogenophaga aromaticivorans]|nr:hypothetical protein [Hydrogenophaga aromaticivorans]
MHYAFAYKPPGPMTRGSLDELMLAMCKGPHLPDAVVVVGLAEDTIVNLLLELRADTSLVAQQRLQGRIPLLFAKFNLTTGVVRATLLDKTFKTRMTEFKSVVEDGVRDWIHSGLQAVFDPKEVVLRAPPGYAYQKPSGGRSELFLKPDLALKSSAIVGFVGLALFHKLFSGRIRRFAALQTVFVDTMAISPIAYGLRELLELCGYKQPFHIESFHSYGGFDEVRRPFKGTSLCLISASTSMSLHEQWITKKEVAVDDVVTLLTLSSAKIFKDGALLAIDAPGYRSSAGPAQLSIRIKGETFLPEQESSKKVLLTDAHHRSDDEVAHFCTFAGKQVFDVFRRPPRGNSKPRALYVDGAMLTLQPEFLSWLDARLVQSVKAATRVIVYQDDSPSMDMATYVLEFCRTKLRLEDLKLISTSALPTADLDKDSGVVVCAAVVGKGSQLLEISRGLRDKHEGPRLYIVGYQVSETRSELLALDANLKHSKSVPYEVAKFGQAAIGTQLGASFASEVGTYYPPSVDLSSMPKLLAMRAKILGTTLAANKMVFLPHGERVDSEMRLRAGFAYWPNSYAPQPCHPEVIATVAVLLQRAREHEKLSEERRLSSASFRHVVLAPENFTRFNDGVLQAALLRCAYPSELDYRGDHAASDFMKSVILRALSRATQESGEATLEFLLALAQHRLLLSEPHLKEVHAVIAEQGGRPAALQRAIDFISRLKASTLTPKSKMPF